MTAPRFLIDENLSPALVEPPRERGFEAMHVNHLGLRTETDWDLLKAIAEQDWVLVTNNAIEFRGRYREIELHPGVVFLLPAVRRPEQLQLFEAALDHIQSQPDLVNRALDVSFDAEEPEMHKAGLLLIFVLGLSAVLWGISDLENALDDHVRTCIGLAKLGLALCWLLRDRVWRIAERNQRAAK